MGLQNVDVGAVLRRLADQKIEAAMAEGKFDNLAGAGKPLDLEPMPADENARLLWWSLRILKQNDVTPDEVRYRKQLDELRDRLGHLTDEAALPLLVAGINELVRKVNTMGTNALQAPVVVVDLEAERQRLRDRAGRGR